MTKLNEVIQDLINIRMWFNDPKEPYGPGRREHLDKIISKYARIHYGCSIETRGLKHCSKWCGSNKCPYSIAMEKAE